MTPDIISTIVGLTEEDSFKRRATNLAGDGIDAVSSVFRSKDRGNKENDNSSASGISNKNAGTGIMESKGSDNKREMLDVPPAQTKSGKNGGTKDACGAGCTIF